MHTSLSLSLCVCVCVCAFVHSRLSVSLLCCVLPYVLLLSVVVRYTSPSRLSVCAAQCSAAMRHSPQPCCSHEHAPLTS